jgi:hypothetical protein
VANVANIYVNGVFFYINSRKNTALKQKDRPDQAAFFKVGAAMG